ncbi:flavin monoamine oxidase family protein [Mucilaginibacter sp. McL0603]|uniref:flavin monoamine oxidase family protein n=1 Tax=Mucilaginibacter sp. McL0603 TaxID=3415670 RepID=UPI003CED1200
MKNTEVIVIGAGATGLMAAYELTKAGKRVIVLEARNRTGGRIHTLDDTSFFKYAELGAEFVHGDLPVTLKLLKEAGIQMIPASGEMWHYSDGKFSKDYQQIDHWNLLMQKLSKLEQDTSIGDFLQREFSENKYDGLRDWVSRFVAGYDGADPFKASVFALRKEWQSEDDNAQHRVKNGYCKMISYLATESKRKGAQLFLNSVVKRIHWEHGHVEVITTDEVSYKAGKVIIALPLGVLQAAASEEGAISISPSIPQYQEAIQQMGFGAIVKILLEFKKAFWEDEEKAKLAGDSLKEMSFLLSKEEIPTWWTQYPTHSTVLTGWLGGPPAEKKKNATNEELFQQSLQSLSNIFKLSIEELKGNLIAWNISNWTADPFTRGSYAYDTVEAPEARGILSTPINKTIYFAGEYLYDGPAMGTVEAALTSGQNTANDLIN